jgi:hypothetical protein
MKLSQQHFEEVTSALAPLRNFSTWLERGPLYCAYVALILQCLNSYWSYAQNGLDTFKFYFESSSVIIFTLVCLFVRRIFMCIIRWRARRMMKCAQSKVSYSDHFNSLK